MAQVEASIVPMIDYNIDHRLVSANNQAFDYDLELFIVYQNYTNLSFYFVFLQLQSKIKTTSAFDKFWSDGRYHQRPRAEILQTLSHESIMQSISDWFGQTDDWL